jgi:RNA polymerase sigma-70 factor (ECF subfamily)
VVIDALFGDCRDRIRRYLLGMVHDPAEAEDLTQETFLRAYRRLDSLRDPDAAVGWLYRIATNVALDRLRQRAPQVAIESEEGAGAARSAASSEPSAEELLERMETSACVERCLDNLSDSYRAVILLHDLHSLSAAEISGVLGIEVGAVKIRLHRARRRLQQVMEHGCAVSVDKQGRPVCESKGDGGQGPCSSC